MPDRTNGSGAFLGSATVKPIRPKLKSDLFAAEVERRILVGELKAGDRLPTEDALCEVFEVSRSVVRDGIRRLVAHGLVKVRQGQGTVVAEPSDTSFALAALALLARANVTVGDVIDARATLETAIAPQAACSGTPEDWLRLEQAYDRFADAVSSGEWDAARSAHLAFHVSVLQALHQPALILLLRPMTEVIAMSSEPPRHSEPADWEVESHWPILAVLRTGDAAGAEQAVRAHYAVLEDSVRYGAYRRQPFRTAFEMPTAAEFLDRR
jgi:GntR family transcriptional regulator, transcriptional repressor for pyruvate dehydrogenase complex